MYVIWHHNGIFYAYALKMTSDILNRLCNHFSDWR